MSSIHQVFSSIFSAASDGYSVLHLDQLPLLQPPLPPSSLSSSPSPPSQLNPVTLRGALLGYACILAPHLSCSGTNSGHLDQKDTIFSNTRESDLDSSKRAQETDADGMQDVCIKFQRALQNSDGMMVVVSAKVASRGCEENVCAGWHD